MKDWNIKEDKAQNAIYLKEDNGGKGRFFRARFLQAGLVKYSFGVCLLKKETIDKFVYKFVTLIKILHLFLQSPIVNISHYPTSFPH